MVLPADDTERQDNQNNSEGDEQREKTPPPTEEQQNIPSITADDLHNAITNAVKHLSDSFSAKFAEMQSQQERLNDQSRGNTVDQRLFPDTPERGQASCLRPTRTTNEETPAATTIDPELARLRRDMDLLTSRINRNTTSAPEIEKALAKTNNTPFTKRIADEPLKDQSSVRMHLYNGTEDPGAWLTVFNVAAKRQAYATPLAREANLCHMFVEHMGKNALNWFTDLAPGTIDSFDELTRKFMAHYTLLLKKGSMDLFTMNQGRDEPLRKYIDRFKAAVAEQITLSDEVKVKALVNGLWYLSKFKESLTLDEPTTIEEALHRSKNYIVLEENTTYFTKQHDPTSGSAKKSEQRAENRRRPVTFSVDKASKSSGDEPQGDTSAAKPSEGDDNHNLSCEFHGRTGHATETCRHLVDILVDAYKKGDVKIDNPRSQNRGRGRSYGRGGSRRNTYVRRDSDDRSRDHDSRPRDHYDRTRDGEERDRDREDRSHDRNDRERDRENRTRNQQIDTEAGRDREDYAEDDRDLPPPPKRRIHMIIGGLPDCDDSVSSIRTYQRKAITARRYPEPAVPGMTIHFSPRDAIGLHMPHNDPLVVELDIHNCEVEKVLVDTGSNVNVIFKDTLTRMGISEDDIKVAAKPLTGFTGDHHFCLGTIYLPIEVGGITKNTKFSVMDRPPVYNAILGTPWIHEMKAVISTYHQCLKFPTIAGVFTLRGSQQIARACLISERRMRTSSSCAISEKSNPMKYMFAVTLEEFLDYIANQRGIKANLGEIFSGLRKLLNWVPTFFRFPLAKRFRSFEILRHPKKF